MMTWMLCRARAIIQGDPGPHERNPSIVTPAVPYLTISFDLERLEDLATNIAEEIIFMEEGEVARNRE